MKKNKKKIILSTTLAVGLAASLFTFGAFSNRASIVGDTSSINGHEFDYASIPDKTWAGTKIELEFYEAALTDIYTNKMGTGTLMEDVAYKYIVPTSDVNQDGSTDIVDSNYYRSMAWVTLFKSTLMSDVSMTNYVLGKASTYPDVFDSCAKLSLDGNEIGNEDSDYMMWMKGVNIYDIMPLDTLFGWMEGTNSNVCIDSIIYLDDVKLDTFKSLYLLAYLSQPYNIYSSVAKYDYFFSQVLHYYQPVYVWQLSSNGYFVDDSEFDTWKLIANGEANDVTTWNTEVDESDITVGSKQKAIPFNKAKAESTEGMLRGFNGIAFLGGPTPGSVINSDITRALNGITASYVAVGDGASWEVDPGAEGDSTHFVNYGYPNIIDVEGSAVNDPGQAGIKVDTVGYLGRVKTMYPIKDGNSYNIASNLYKDINAVAPTNLFTANGMDNQIPVFYLVNDIRITLPQVFASAKQYWRTQGYYIEVSGEAIDLQNYIDKDLVKIISNDSDGFLWFDGQGIFDGNNNGLLDWWWWKE